MRVLTILYLGVNGWTDWKRKEVDLKYTIGFIVVTAGIYLWKGLPQNWSGLLPGVCLCCLACWQKEKIGTGDGIAAMGLGWAVGVKKVLEILTGAFLMAAVAGVLLLAAGKKRTTELPFVPFLCIAYLTGGYFG